MTDFLEQYKREIKGVKNPNMKAKLIMKEFGKRLNEKLRKETIIKLPFALKFIEVVRMNSDVISDGKETIKTRGYEFTLCFGHKNFNNAIEFKVDEALNRKFKNEVINNNKEYRHVSK